MVKKCRENSLPPANAIYSAHVPDIREIHKKKRSGIPADCLDNPGRQGPKKEL